MPLASPHYYFRRSVLRLALMNFLGFLFNYILAKPPKYGDLRALKSKKNSQVGKKALILGNGPSIDLLNIKVAKEYFDCFFAVNHFYKTRVSKEIIPTHYVLSDPKSFETSELGINSQFLNFIKKSKIEIYVPHYAKKTSAVFSSDSLFVFDDRQRFIFNKRVLPVKPRNYASVTLYKAISIALYLGFDEVCIIGLDNTEFLSYKGTPNNKVLHTGKSYGASKTDQYPSYEMEMFPSGLAGRMQSYAHLFGDLSKFPKGRLFNLDLNSLTDTVDKVDPNHPLSVRS
jgi:hypothetical protein